MNDAAPAQERVFLVVVDETAELKIALRYAARRAQHTGGRVALLYVIEPTELQHWGAVEDLMKEERREEAEALLQKLAAEVTELAGTMPIIYIREGRRRDELLAMIGAHPSAPPAARAAPPAARARGGAGGGASSGPSGRTAARPISLWILRVFAHGSLRRLRLNRDRIDPN
jgi:hypothetical protein